MKKLAYYNGTISPLSDMKIPLSDRAIFFGDGVYDAAVGANGKIYLEGEHIARLEQSAASIGLSNIPSVSQISDALHCIVKESGIPEFFLYFQLTRSGNTRRHSYIGFTSTNFLITIEPFTMPEPSRRLSLITKEDLRYYYCNVKTINLLPAVLASGAAEECKCDEAVLHRGQTVTECAHSNIFILKGGILKTHPTNNLILPGITRKHLLQCCGELGIKCDETPFTLEEMFSADEVLVTSTSKLCHAVEKIDDKSVGGKARKYADMLCRTMHNNYVNAII